MKKLEYIWKTQLENRFSVGAIQPIIIGDLVILHHRQQLFALNKTTGQKQWIQQIEETRSSMNLFIAYKDSVITGLSPKKGKKMEGMLQFFTRLISFDSQGIMRWKVDFPCTLSKNSFYHYKSTLWLLGESNDNIQWLFKLDLEEGKLERQILEKKAYQMILLDQNFIFSYASFSAKHTGLFTYNPLTKEYKNIFFKTIIEIYQNLTHIFLLVKEGHTYFLENVDKKYIETVINRQEVSSETVVVEDEILYFLTKNDKTYLNASTLNFELKWQVEVLEDSLTVRNSGSYLMVSTGFEKVLISKEDGEILQIFSSSACIPTSENQYIYIKEKDYFFKATLEPLE